MATQTQGEGLAGLQTALAPTAQSVWELGAAYLIRTVTMFDTGRVVAVTEHEIVLEDAAWIADTGRFADALQKCEFSEVEPFPDGREAQHRMETLNHGQENEHTHTHTHAGR
jgi:hypothetical protein